MATLRSHYIEEVRSKGGLGHHTDLILVLDRGILTTAIKPPGDEWGAAFLDTLHGSKADEGLLVGAAVHEMGENSLDAFLRYLLLPLMHFRPVVPHPGFDWNPPHCGDRPPGGLHCRGNNELNAAGEYLDCNQARVSLGALLEGVL